MRFSDRFVILIFVLAVALVGSLSCQGVPSFEVEIDTEVSHDDTGDISKLETALVTRVIDGDTVELENGELVRYLGIDTPETVHPEKPVECFGPEASDRNKELVEGRIVSLFQDGPDRDSYDRLLRYVFIDGTFVNGDLVWGGYAYARSYGDAPLLYQTLVQLERSAREGERGLWEICD